MKQAIEVIEKNRSFVVTTHCNPEGDAIGSSLALALFLRQIGKDAKVVTKDPIPYFLQYLPEKDLISRSPDLGSGFDVLCVCDCADIERTGYYRNPAPGGKINYSCQEVINIDHHVTNRNFGTVNWIEGEASATGEMIYDLISAMNGQMDQSIATAIYTAIITETGSFHHANTTPKIFQMASECARKGIDVNAIARGLFESSSKGRLQLLSMVLGTLELFAGGRAASVAVTGEMFRKTGTTAEDTENFVGYPRSVNGVEVAVLFRENSLSECKVSLRSQKEVDVSEIAGSFGGGGHRKAAGCTLKGTISEVKMKIHAAVEKALLAA